jgi:hypothetical protein
MSPPRRWQRYSNAMAPIFYLLFSPSLLPDSEKEQIPIPGGSHDR